MANNQDHIANNQGHKVFNDAIHGSIELPLLCVRIMNTPEFQRLRFIKQVGPSYFVYPAASHNRFEHSLGVAHLAGEFAKQLKKKQPALEIKEKDVLCVQVAGLCHDLGHGPFGHLWQEFMVEHQEYLNWTHEKASVEMLRYLLTSNKINVEEYGLNTEDDITFIQEMIHPTRDWPLKGRPKEKSFLFQIVANSENGVDVDKFDYFLRDSHSLGVSVSFDYRRLMQNSRVVKNTTTNLLSICYRDKAADDLFEMFRNRCQLHKKAYQHRTVQLVSVMILDVFNKASKHLPYKRSQGDDEALQKTVNKMSDYSLLTDDVLMQVLGLESDEQEVKDAKGIVRKLFSRDLYPVMGKTSPMTGGKTLKKDLKDKIATNLKKLIVQYNNTYKKREADVHQKALDSFRVYHTLLDFGNKEKDPLEKIWFYSKKNGNKVFRKSGQDVSTMMPRSFQEVTVWVCSCSYDAEVIKVLQDVSEKACEELDWEWIEDDPSTSEQ